MVFYPSVMGMKSNDHRFDTIGQNVSNAATEGYKETRPLFKNLVVEPCGSPYIPGGVLTTTRVDILQQGAITTTNHDTNIAIQRCGMFLVTDPNNPTENYHYTRAGRFEPNQDKILENTAGYILRGFKIEDGVDPVVGEISGTVPVDLSSIAEEAFESTTTISACGNLNADALSATDVFSFSSPVFDEEGAQQSVQFSFSRVDAGYQQYETDDLGVLTALGEAQQAILGAASSAQLTTLKELQSRQAQVDITGVADATLAADTLAFEAVLAADPAIQAALLNTGLVGGNQQALTGEERLERLQAVAGHQMINTWYLTSTPVGIAAGQEVTNQQFVFDEEGALLRLGEIDPSSGDVSEFDTLPDMTIDWGGTAGTSTLSLDFGTVGQKDGFTQLVQQGSQAGSLGGFQQDGRGLGQFQGVRIVDDGILCADYSNGLCKQEYMIPLAYFRNFHGLDEISGQAFDQTLESGAARLFQPGEGAEGEITGRMIEQSTVDVADAFTDLIMTQKDYVANSKAFTVNDRLYEVATSLKR